MVDALAGFCGPASLVSVVVRREPAPARSRRVWVPLRRAEAIEHELEPLDGAVHGQRVVLGLAQRLDQALEGACELTEAAA